MSNGQILKKLRGFVVNERTGAPVPGVVIALAATDSDGQPFVLKRLASDKTGFYSFDLSRALESKTLQEATQISLSVGQRGISSTQVTVRGRTNFGGKSIDLDLIPKLGDYASPIFDIAVEVNGEHTPNTVLESIENPDLIDRETAVRSFSKRLEKSCSDECCDGLAPVDITPRDFYLYDLGTMEIQIPDKYNPRVSTIDVLKEYKQTWIPLGHSLGDLSYSLPLAPGESVNLAVVDWSRREEGKRGEEITYAERLDSVLTRKRDIEETVLSTVEEIQEGYSMMNSSDTSFGIGVTIPVKGVPVNLQASNANKDAMARSLSQGSRKITGSGAQRIADTTVQNSSFARNMNATVVMRVEQSEKDKVETRTISNNNHCHALTIQYFEVLRNYKVRTRLNGVRKPKMVKYKLFDFTENDVLKYYRIFKALSAGTPFEEYVDAVLEKRSKVSSKLVTDWDGWVGNQKIRRLTASLYVDDTGGASVLKEGAATANAYIKVKHVNNPKEEILNFVGDLATGTEASANAVTLSTDKKLNDIESVTFYSDWNSGSDENDNYWDNMTVSKIKVFAELYNGRTILAAEYTAKKEFGKDETLDIPRTNLEMPAENWVTTGVEDADKLGQLIQTLLDYLNLNKVYFSKLLWQAMDKDERAIYMATLPGGGSGLENAPLAFFGDMSVFAANGNDSEIPLEDYGPIEEETRFVSMPTRGVFAEVMLSNCNACEKRDVTRYWDWQESPINPPPTISGVTPGSRAGEMNLNPSALPNSVLNIVNPPAVPDPTGLAAALQVAGKGDLFRDMSGLAALGLLAAATKAPTVALPDAKKIVDTATALKKSAGMSNAEVKSAIKQSMGVVDPKTRSSRHFDFAATIEAAYTLDRNASPALIGNSGEMSVVIFAAGVRNDLEQGGAGQTVTGDYNQSLDMQVADNEPAYVTVQFKPSDAPGVTLSGKCWFVIPPKPGSSLYFTIAPEVKTVTVRAKDATDALDKTATNWKVEAGIKAHMNAKAKLAASENLGVESASGELEGDQGVEGHAGGSYENSGENSGTSSSSREMDFEVSFLTGKLVIKPIAL